MNDKLKLWHQHTSWDDAERAWDSRAKALQESHPLKTIRHLPTMPGITEETAKNLKWKAISYLFQEDKEKVIPRYLLKRPFRYALGLAKSLMKKKSYLRDDDLFLYGVKSVEDFKTQLEDPNSLFIVGFSYCHKPHECPSGRFSAECIHDPLHPVCGQCFIGKATNALPKEKAIPLFIPTIHYIGEKLLEILHANPKKKLLFLITACEMTLEMFGDFGNMVSIQGIGVRLDGRICNTMKAFELSEKGIKPGLTLVQEHTQSRILELIKHRHNRNGTTCGTAWGSPSSDKA